MTTLRKAVSHRLLDLGFRSSGRMHRRRVDSEFSEVVDTGPLGGRADIAPFVGLRHDGVEHLFSECLGVDKDAWVATVGANVGYVLGREYLSWADPAAVDAVLEHIASALGRYARVRSLDELAHAWSIAGLDDPGRCYRQVCIAVLLNRKDDVTRSLLEAKAAYCARPDGVCEQFLGFERRVLVRCGLTSAGGSA